MKTALKFICECLAFEIQVIYSKQLVQPYLMHTITLNNGKIEYLQILSIWFGKRIT